LEEELDGADQHGEAKTLLRAIQREIDRLTGITQEYLRLARLPDPELAPEDVGGVVRSVVDFLRRELELAGVHIDVSLEPRLPQVPMDEAQLRQALLNLLRNAREAMPDGGRVTVT